MARIGIDIDGVLYPFGDAFREYMTDYWAWPPEMCTPQTEWHFYEKWGLSAAGFKMMCNRAADRGKLWNAYKIMPGNLSALGRLQAAGHSLHIITDRQFGARPAVSHQATAKWLLENAVPYDTLTFSGDKTIVATDYMIDDKLENYDALAQSCCTPYLLSQPWNDDHDEGRYARRRVDSVSAFADLIIEAEKEPIAA